MGECVWGDAIRVLRDYGTRNSEGLLFLGGVITGDEPVVTGLYIINHVAQGDRVVVSPAEGRWLLRTLRMRDEKLVAQVHSHRKGRIHSPGDDLWATSFHEGFISIVVPRFGNAIEWPVECGFFEYRAGVFEPWSEAEIRSRISLASDVVERDVDPPQVVVEETRWVTFAKRLRSIAARRR